MSEETVQLVEITEQPQYGRGFYYEPANTNGISRKLKIVDWTDATNTEKLFKAKLFIKTPRRDATFEEKAGFAKEFAHAVKLNKVADKLIERKDRDKTSHVIFKIPKLLAKAEIMLEAGATEKTPCLIYEFAEGIGIQKTEPGKSELSASDFLDFAKALAGAIQVLHNRGMVHSFLVPRDILWEPREGPTDGFNFKGNFNIVGFGYARLCDKSGKSFIGDRIDPEDEFFLAPETRNTDANKAYWFPADIYSIGAILLYLLCRRGEEIETGDKSNTPEGALKFLEHLYRDPKRLRKQIATRLWRSNKKLIHQNENILKIIDSCVRYEPKDRYACLEELLELITLARNCTSVQPAPADSKSSDADQASHSISHSKLQELSKASVSTAPIESSKSVDNDSWFDDKIKLAEEPFNRRFMEMVLPRLKHEIETIQRAHLEVYGSRDEIIYSLCALLAHAGDKWFYDTVTLPDYWSDENLGTRGRFLAMNKHKARNGLIIRRVFLVPSDVPNSVSPTPYHTLPEPVQDMFDIQERMIRHMKGDINENSKELFKAIDIRVRGIDLAEIQSFEAEGNTVAYLGTGNYAEGAIYLNFYSSARQQWIRGKPVVQRAIQKVRYWWDTNPDEREKGIREAQKKFERHFENAVPLEAYVHGGRVAPDLHDKGLSVADVLKQR